MPTTIGVAREFHPGEHRVALVPDVAKRFRALGAEILIEKDAGENSAYPDAAFADVRWTDNAGDIWTQSDVVLCVRPPALADVARMKPGAVLLGFLQPYQNPELVRALAECRITSFAAELVPRISRAQSMDALSSQAAVSGYLCAVIAAAHSPKFFPMLTYAAGTVRPARVLVIGAGVAGLQAIATARRLGAMVEAYDVRPETREQIESLGAKFVDTGVAASGQGGYARELTEDEKRQQAEKLGKAIANADALITTAAIPGKQAPRIVSAAMVGAMKYGAVIVDMAAESGGNVEGTVPGEIAQVGHVKIVGHANLPSRMPYHASEMFARNLFNFLSPHLKDGVLAPDWDDEVVAGTALTRDGQLVHAGVKAVLEKLEKGAA
ncbi:MAG: NAD(P) transhydrogenase subunit alpha [Candidatus Accumulibacter sp. 66-26]|nr:Re/Si-specific NAD(P)(+) transhydrogenase subunit alpha [Accumulibacter sp.]OJW46451.1 MAG: NAD(P) transhydrogenase subunit alpha [Candidatus Accumulibacter sp. 66-26]